MEEKTKRIIIGSAILLVLLLGSGITYYVVNRGSNNQETAIENDSNSATTTDATLTENESTEDLMAKNDSTEKDKETTTEDKDNLMAQSGSTVKDKDTTTEEKKSEKENQNNSNSNKQDATTEATKPENKPTTTESAKPESKPSTTEEVTTESTPTGCNHDWKPQYKTVTVPAKTHTEEKQVLVEEAWDEPTTETHVFCGGCGEDITYLSSLDRTTHSYVCQGGSNIYTKDVPGTPIHHDAVYETQTVTVVDEPEHTEKVVNGYKCSICGATK